MPEPSFYGPPAERVAVLMSRALALAERGGGATAPNPMVGCVIVNDDGRILGEGFHPRVGDAHAEVFAIEMAKRIGRPLRGTTVVVNLEPCASEGRTPPCVDALVGVGAKRVYYANPDPHDGKGGAERLRAAGLEVEQGVGQEPARRLNEAWFHWVETGLPFFHVKVAQTLSSHMTRGVRGARWITSSSARAVVHRMRRRHAAVLVGIGTVLTDDPFLTVRDWPPRVAGVDWPDPAPEVDWPRVQPRRVVLDSWLQIPLDSRLVATSDTSPVLIFCRPDADKGKQAALEKHQVEVIRTTPSSKGLNLMAVARGVAERGVTGVFVEPGPTLLAALFEAGLVDRWTAFVAPDWVGGADALRLPTPAEGIVLDDFEWELYGRDAMVTGLVRRARKE
jgi:diaminohydroxyphosphoribosylaminopyrimidine deaminase/5-amino-6-(5-phosphoribosylamino)uracil reductase